MEAKIDIKLNSRITVELTESEARAFDAITGYGFDEFLKVFKQHLGKHYIEPHEQGAKSLFEHRHSISTALAKLDKVKALLTTQPNP